MPEVEHLSRAPIVEALIDLRVRLPEGTSLDSITAFADAIKDEYPDRRERTRGQVQLNVAGPGAIKVATSSTGIDGLVLHSADGRQIVQGRLDGFTFSRLTPYQKWSDIRKEARRLWEIYLKEVKPTAVQRLAVRYINRMPLPIPFESFSEWIETLPHVASGIPRSLAGFFLRLQIPFDEFDAKATVVLAVEPGDYPDTVPILFDIDAFSAPHTLLDEEQVWTVMEKLRQIKNQVFFKTVTERTLELFR